MVTWPVLLPHAALAAQARRRMVAAAQPVAGRWWPGAGRRVWRHSGHRVGQRPGAAVVVLGGLVLRAAAPLTVPDAPAQGGHVAGRYLVVLAASCTPVAATTKACQALLGPFAAGLNPLYATCDAVGHCTFDDTFAVSEHHGGAPLVCGPTVVTRPFNGTCRGSDHGTLRIKKGVTGLPEFWVVAETTTFYGRRTRSGIANPFGTNIDTGIPIAPGVYDTTRYLGLVGQGPTAGVSIQILVTKLPL